MDSLSIFVLVWLVQRNSTHKGDLPACIPCEVLDISSNILKMIQRWFSRASKNCCQYLQRKDDAHRIPPNLIHEYPTTLLSGIMTWLDLMNGIVCDKCVKKRGIIKNISFLEVVILQLIWSNSLKSLSINSPRGCLSKICCFRDHLFFSIFWKSMMNMFRHLLKKWMKQVRNLVGIKWLIWKPVIALVK